MRYASSALSPLGGVRDLLEPAGFDVRKKINVPMTKDLAHIKERWLAKARKLGREIGSW